MKRKILIMLVIIGSLMALDSYAETMELQFTDQNSTASWNFEHATSNISMNTANDPSFENAIEGSTVTNLLVNQLAQDAWFAKTGAETISKDGSTFIIKTNNVAHGMRQNCKVRPNTTYTVFYKNSAGEWASESTWDVRVYDTSLTQQLIRGGKTFNSGAFDQITVYVRSYDATEISISDIMLIEGDWTTCSLNYFEGEQSLRGILVEQSNENIFPLSVGSEIINGLTVSSNGTTVKVDGTSNGYCRISLLGNIENADSPKQIMEMKHRLRLTPGKSYSFGSDIISGSITGKALLTLLKADLTSDS